MMQQNVVAGFLDNVISNFVKHGADGAGVYHIADSAQKLFGLLLQFLHNASKVGLSTRARLFKCPSTEVRS